MLGLWQWILVSCHIFNNFIDFYNFSICFMLRKKTKAIALHLACNKKLEYTRKVKNKKSGKQTRNEKRNEENLDRNGH